MNIYVGNLAYEVDEDTLRELFSEYGDVESAKVITDRDSGRSKGFGFIEMPDQNQALEAIKALNGKEYAGRELTVNEARPQKPRHDRFDRRGRGGGGRGRY